MSTGQQAGVPTFSPAAGTISSGTQITISTATGACSSYIYWNFTGTSMGSGTNSTTSSAITSSSTLYAQVIGCPGFADSSIGSAAYSITGVVDPPTASPNSEYIYVSVGATVTLSDTTSGATICYRTDGTDPAATVAGTCDAGSTTYSTGISVSTTTTVKALGTKLLSTNSSVASFTYTLSSLVLQLNMADGSGTTATDSCCGDNFTITAGSGGWGTLAGVADGIYNFDGSTTHMVGANYTNLNFNYNQPFSVFIVSYPLQTGETMILGRLNTASNFQGWEVGNLSTAANAKFNPVLFLINTYPTKAITVETSTGYSWSGLYDVLITYDGSNTAAGVNFYVHGSVASKASPLEDTLTANATTNAVLPRIGERIDNSQPFKGDLGPIYVWNRVLTSGEASALHSNFYAPPN